MWPRKYYLYIVLAILLLALGLTLGLTLTRNNSSTSEKDINVNDIVIVDTIPEINTIVMADVEDYDGYIFHPTDATYPQEVLDKLNDWPVPSENKLPGRKYLYQPSRKDDPCKWVQHLENRYCVIKEL